MNGAIDWTKILHQNCRRRAAALDEGAALSPVYSSQMPSTRAYCLGYVSSPEGSLSFNAVTRPFSITNS